MLFTEPRFLVFFVLVYAIYWLIASNRGRKGFLLLSSYVFYGTWDVRFLSLIIMTTLVGYYAARFIDGSRVPKIRRRILRLSLLCHLGTLGFFKYFNFFTDSLKDLLQVFGLTPEWTTLNIILPVGISFFTFHTMGYVIDVYWRKLPAAEDLLDIAFFVAFFPQLVAGPILRALEFLPQLTARREFRDIALKSCLLLFLVGFFKKVAVSDNVAFYVDLVFEHQDAYAASSIVLGVVLYAIQIYCDFSGYTDMAIAVAGLLGYSLPRNFDAPYLSAGIIDFWRRWHISLSFWLRDYLYIPLGGNRHGRLMRYRNLMLTMLLGGLWHGAAWTFVIWGGLHGLALCASHLWRDHVGRRVPMVLALPFTFYFVNMCWIFFRAKDIETALAILAHYVTFSSPGTQTLPVALYVLPWVAGLIHVLWRYGRGFERVSALPGPVFSVLSAIAAALAVAFMPSGYQPFIYFQF